ncbi:hypothetical protein EL22_28465 [Halostagnicola sp. A56]|nr:hypothetical protein EL22_28465 [Halostagnicola sp. A56]
MRIIIQRNQERTKKGIWEETNDHELVVKCIQSLESIGVEYLEKLQSPVDDDFMRELNDQFEFLIQSASEEYTSQKYLGPLCESLGQLSRSTFVHTENQAQTSMWLQSLKNVFKQTYPDNDRTEAIGKSVKEINRTVVLSLEQETDIGTNHYWIYSGDIEDIAKIGARNAAIFPLRKCLGAYRWHFIAMSNALIADRRYFQSQVNYTVAGIHTQYK